MREELIRKRREASNLGRREEERQSSARRLQQSDDPIFIQQLQQCYRGLSWRYEHIVRQLFLRSHEGEQRLWQQFASLTVEQRQAVLHYAAKSKQHVEQILQTDQWQSQMMQAIREVEHVRFQAQESMKEANIYESGAIEQYPIVHWQLEIPALIAPYREMMQWLMYKAKKQGEIVLLQQLLRLPVTTKKLVLHRLAGPGRLHFKRFVERMTVRIGWHDWVDWSALRENMTQVKLDQQQGEQYVAQQLAELEAAEDSQSPDHHQETKETKATKEAATEAMPKDDAALPVKAKQLESGKDQKGMPAQQTWNESTKDKAVPANKRLLIQQLGDSKWLLWLLTGLASRDKRSAMSKKDVIKPDHSLAIVQRFLGISAKLSGKQLERVMERQLHRHGFSSVQQCYAFLVTEIIAILYIRAVVNKEKEYMQLLEIMGLLDGAPTVSRQQLAARFGITGSQ